MKKYKGVPVEAAQEIAEKYDKDMVLIITHDGYFGMSHYTTYGKTGSDKLHAAKAMALARKYHFNKDAEYEGEKFPAPRGFEHLEWSDEKDDFVEKENG